MPSQEFKNSPAQIELLIMLSEESSEVAKSAAKALRHGLLNYHPNTDEVNKHSIEREIADLLAIVFILSINGDIQIKHISNHLPEAVIKKMNYTYDLRDVYVISALNKRLQQNNYLMSF